MKSEYFKSKPSQIRGTREKEMEDSINWDRIIYLSMLGILFVAFAYFLVDYYMIIEGNGRVIANRYSVRFPEDVRVMDIHVSEGDSIQKNDLLFSFAMVHQNQSPEQTQDEKRKLEEKLMEVAGDINEEQTEFNNHNEKLTYYKEQKELVKKEIRLGVSNMKDLRNIEQEIMDIENDIALNKQRLHTLNKKRSIMEQWKNAPQMFNTYVRMRGDEEITPEGELGGAIETTRFTSPTKGVVEQIKKNISELAYRSELIMTITRKAENVSIQAIFPQSSLKHVSRGDTMNVTFNNGIKSKGRVFDFFTPQLSNWNQAGIGQYDINNHVVIGLKPIDDEAFKTWQNNSNIGVTVSKFVL